MRPKTDTEAVTDDDLSEEVAKDRLITLVSILFQEAELDYKGNNLSFDASYIAPLLKVWYGETYIMTLDFLKCEREAEEMRKKEEENSGKVN